LAVAAALHRNFLNQPMETRMKRLLTALAIASTTVFVAPAFAAYEADCAAEWSGADANKDGVLAGPEANRYLAYIRVRAQVAPEDGRITQDRFMEACRTDTFKAQDPEPGAPLKGANSFTEGQAKDRALAAGITEVTSLTKDGDGIWRGNGKKGDKEVAVAVDFKGNVVSQ
jgi:hypothetical protein